MRWGHQCAILDLLSSTNVPFKTRRACVETQCSMIRFLASHVLDTSSCAIDIRHSTIHDLFKSLMHTCGTSTCCCPPPLCAPLRVAYVRTLHLALCTHLSTRAQLVRIACHPHFPLHLHRSRSSSITAATTVRSASALRRRASTRMCARCKGSSSCSGASAAALPCFLTSGLASCRRPPPCCASP